MSEKRLKSIDCILSPNGILDTLFESIRQCSKFCRICQVGNESRNPLIRSPCDCTGSVGHIHVICYKTWRSFRRRNFCEICMKRYRFADDGRSSWNIGALRFRRLFIHGYWKTITRNLLHIICLWQLIRENLIRSLSALELIISVRQPLERILVFVELFYLTDIVFSISLLWTREEMQHIFRAIDRWWHDVDEESFRLAERDSVLEDLLEMFDF